MNGSSDGLLPSTATEPTSSNTTVCSLTSPYDTRIISSYPRLSGFYDSSYPEQHGFYPSGTAPFYSSLAHPYELKDPTSGNWGPLPQTTCYPYDPTLYGPYADRYGAMDSAARRKNVTRETTNTLKAWLHEHRKNPYPTKGEKIMLAIITKMTLTQVSTWFANARRRLKKENKMTWEPRNRNDDEKGDTLSDDDDCNDDHHSTNQTDNELPRQQNAVQEVVQGDNKAQPLDSKGRADEAKSAATSSIKPKIWSLAATAISDKPKSPFSSSTSSTSSPPMAQLSQLPLSVHAAPSAFTPTATGNLSSWYYHPAVSLNHRTVPGYTSSNSYGTNYGMVLPRNPHQTSPLPPSD